MFCFLHPVKFVVEVGFIVMVTMMTWRKRMGVDQTAIMTAIIPFEQHKLGCSEIRV